MDDLLSVIVNAMNTVDGNKGTADAIAQQILKLKNRGAHSSSGPTALTQNEQDEIYRSVLMKYKILRIRCKISYLAF